MTRLVVGALVIAVALSLSTNGRYLGAPAAALTDQRDAVDDEAGWAGSPALEQKVAAFQEELTGAGALGFYRQQGSETLVTVIPADLSADATRYISELSAPVPMTVVTSRLSLSTMDEISSVIRGLPAKFVSESDSIAYFFNPEKDLVTVSTTLRSDEVSAALGNMWQYVDYDEAVVQSRGGRFTDTSPFYGGAAFDVVDFDLPDWDCTTGFTVVNGSGTKGLISAAHCGDGVHNTVRTAGGIALGTIVDRHCPHAQHADFELITGKAYENFIYVGSTAAGTSIEVSEAGLPAAGATYRYSGATTYERTNQKMLQVNSSYTTFIEGCGVSDWVTAMVWTRPTSSGGQTCDVQDGDSGGPFYLTYAGSPGTVGIRGIVTASDPTYCFGITYPRIANQLGWSIYVH